MPDDPDHYNRTCYVITEEVKFSKDSLRNSVSAARVLLGSTEREMKKMV
jgi:hypothetical protein